MNKPLAFAALAEAATGVAIFVAPSLVARLLLGTELSGVAVAVGRVAGISLLSLGFACWPGKHYRRIATRYEKTARNYLSFVHLASGLVMLGVTVNMT
jgi:hypothetical protein